MWRGLEVEAGGRAADRPGRVVAAPEGDALLLQFVLETMGYNARREGKAQAARGWVDAVNAEGAYGRCEVRVCGGRENGAD